VITGINGEKWTFQGTLEYPIVWPGTFLPHGLDWTGLDASVAFVAFRPHALLHKTLPVAIIGDE
jgi:hypothetical protein